MSNHFRDRRINPGNLRRSRSPSRDHPHGPEEGHTTAQHHATYAHRQLPHLAPATAAETVPTQMNSSSIHQTDVHAHHGFQTASASSYQDIPTSSASHNRAAPRESTEHRFNHSRNISVPSDEEMEEDCQTSWKLADARWRYVTTQHDAWAMMAYAKAADRDKVIAFYYSHGHAHFHCRIKFCKHNDHIPGFANDGKTLACTTGLSQKEYVEHFKNDHAKRDDGTPRWLFACIHEKCTRLYDADHGVSDPTALRAHMSAFGGSQAWHLPHMK